MSVRCKFVCNSETKRKDNDGFVYDYQMSVVYGGSEENKFYWRYTPGGQFNVSSFKESQFIVGREYFIDITDADELKRTLAESGQYVKLEEVEKDLNNE